MRILARRRSEQCQLRSARRQNTNVEQAHLRPWDQRVRPRCQRVSPSRRRDCVRDQQGTDHAQEARHGFYQKVVDYCLAAEGISLDDVDLVVRNCYVLPVEDLELRLLSQYVPEVMD